MKTSLRLADKKKNKKKKREPVTPRLYIVVSVSFLFVGGGEEKIFCN